ncbi:Detected protein of unknown function [Hibiscus syriacus]|uniref:Uncharacterized protein n=1 Tax=Hibiscus syriacus TaxID=106335 RepID=A0A6A2XXT0_HIBSY|nr:Detected protein of unknown function [Hibiscus syriacus]
MGVAVLQPEDCLKLPNPMKHHKNLFPNPGRSKRAHSNRRNRSPTTSPPPSADTKFQAKNFVMGQVKILKHDESKKTVAPETRLTESDNSNNNKVNPVTFYAGSAFITSPPPSSVPMPAFFAKKIEVSVKNSEATSDLRRMLRLEL